MPLAGLILAGGEGRRMGWADKALMLLQGKPLLAHLLDRLSPQITPIALSANGDPERFAGLCSVVLRDEIPDQGPLAGILAGLDWAAAQGADALVTVPVDTPFLPADLVARLAKASLGGQRPCYARSLSTSQDGTETYRAHPAVALWPVSMRPMIQAGLETGERRLRIALQDGVAVDFSETPDPFANLNTLEDLAQAEADLAQGRRSFGPPAPGAHDGV